MGGVIQDVHFAIRSFRRNPGSALAVVLTLALGTGATTAVFNVVHGVLLRPLPYKDPERIVSISSHGPVSPADFADWRVESRSFEALAYVPAWRDHGLSSILWDDGRETIHAEFVPSAFFDVMGVKPALGRAFLLSEDQRGQTPTAVISDRLWRRRYNADAAIIGRTVTVDSYNLRRHTIVGVMPAGFDFPEGTELWLPQGFMSLPIPGPGSTARCCPWLQVVGRLAVPIGQARAELSVIARRIAERYPQARHAPGVEIVALRDQLTAPVRKALWTLLGAVAFLQLIACANAANLLLARASARGKEMAIRSALGATRARLMRQLLTESVLLSLAGGAAGTLLAVSAGPLSALATRLPRFEEIRLDGAVLAFSLALSLATGIAFGLAPALHAHGLRAGRVRKFLAVSEVALAFLLLAGAGLLIRSFVHLRAVDPGFQAARLLAADIDMSSSVFSTSGAPGPNRPQVFFERLLARVRALPGVVHAGAIDVLPLANSSRQSQSYLTPGATEALMAQNYTVTPGYFSAMGIPLRSGRFITEGDTDGAPPVLVVNQAMARRYWPGEDPIGKEIALGTRERQERDRHGQLVFRHIVGVVGDVRASQLDAEAAPQAYLPFFQSAWRNATLVVRAANDPVLLGPAIRQEAKGATVAGVRAMDDVIAEATWQPRLRTQLLSAFSALALAFAGAGIAAVMSQNVAQRTREIGIRMAIGAQQSAILRMVLGQGIVLALTGLAIGAAGVLALSRLLRGLLYEIQPLDPAALALAALVLFAAALPAAYFPARRASRIEAADAIRCEN